MDNFDLLVVGGGINGTAIARDAAMRGLKVLLVERDDLASHTSSASSKLIHGGLRYLEQYEVRLVRESLHEREILLRTAPHIVRPLRFILPDPKGGRPWWMIRIGLWLYGMLAGRSSLNRPRRVPDEDAAVRTPLKGEYRLAEYWDAWVDDARLVALNAVAAAEHGARIATRTALVSARVEGGAWHAELSDGRSARAGMIVNAAGPWVAEVLGQKLGGSGAAGVRLIKGAHIAVPRLFEGDHAYILQSPDGRVVFALPYGDWTLIGTTDTPVGRPEDAEPSIAEIEYLCAAANSYFTRQTVPGDVRWAFAGIRALYDDGAAKAKDVTRDYRLELEDRGGARLLSVFGGKITTARALAEEAIDTVGISARSTTRDTPLPGGEQPAAVPDWMPAAMGARLAQAYGGRLARIVGSATSLEGLGRHFGGGLHEAEVRHLVDVEFARSAEDVLWRRTKLGLVLTDEEARALEEFIGVLRPLPEGGGLSEGESPVLAGDPASSPRPTPHRGEGRAKRPRRLGWLVDEDERVELLLAFAPVYPNVVAHHVTLPSRSGDPLPPAKVGEIVGIADDGAGVQALVVRIDGGTERPDGGTWHITWSLAEGRRAKESNDVIEARGWTAIDLPVPVTLRPAEI